ncbi:MAG: phytanoyl-CoA dioxygenase family protein [Armatimonadetes bacterium]|nr:phytanoyl-CoA dioxygenase family protein [Armatimonadota bacterium]
METTTSAEKFTDQEMDRLSEELNRDGICVLRGLLAPAKIDAWADAFDRLYQERQNRPGGLAPREESRYYLTIPWVPPFVDTEIFANPVVLGVLNRVFAQEYVMVQLGADVPVKGSDYQEIHRDYRPLFWDHVITPLYALAVNFPLVDVTEENGPLEMARGTHRLTREDALRKVESGEIPMESFTMAKGDVSIRTPLALHRGTPNRSDRPRPMVVMGYVMHWLHTPQVDVKVRREDYERFPEPVQQLLRCEVVDELAQDRAETYVNFKF